MNNNICVVYKTFKNGKTDKVINFDIDANLYRFSDSSCKKAKFDKSDELYTEYKLLKKLIIIAFSEICTSLNIDTVEIIKDIIKDLNYHDTQEIKNA